MPANRSALLGPVRRWCFPIYTFSEPEDHGRNTAQSFVTGEFFGAFWADRTGLPASDPASYATRARRSTVEFVA